MRTTRSTTRGAAGISDAPAMVESTLAGQGKRKSEPGTPKTPTRKRARVTKTSPIANGSKIPPIPSAPEVVDTNVDEAAATTPSKEALPLLPAVLTFSFEDAKQHLISVDHRFNDLFSKMECKPFQQLERVHPFRALVSSIVGQQISWLAARSVNHKFVRLYDPSLPEKVDDALRTPSSFYPSPQQVAKTDIPTLRTAGLSQRKAEYVLDLAQRFSDGRLSTEKMYNADDDELANMLIEVRGIGRWTVDMFAIFSLRRPDILPVGDLGVQRGLIVWFLSLHSPKHNWGFTPQKVGASSSKKTKGKTSKAVDSDELPVIGEGTPSSSKVEVDATLGAPDISSIPPATALEDDNDDVPSMPPAFTPSIKNTLNKPGVDEGSLPKPLPEGLTIEVLKSRLSGKKIKGAFLTPKEMEDLTESWKPYRSLGVYYMWSIADVPA